MHKVMKYFIAASLAILALNASIAQTKLSVKLTSSIINQRISHSADTIDIGSGSNAFVPSFHLCMDFPISKSYFISSGLGYISKRININQVAENSTNSLSYNIQYLQLPATLKLYTSEISLDKKLYFQFGPVFDIAVHTKENSSIASAITKFRPVDVTLLFSAGIDILVAPNTSVQLGINYTRGLVNIVSESTLTNSFSIKNDLYGIEIAIKF